MLGLFEKCEVKAGSTVTFYNHFTSLPLPDELTELGICGLGVFQQNRFQDALFVNKAKLAKKRSGSYGFAIDCKNLVESWLDSKVVTCSTNYVTCNPVSTAQRWSKSTKKKIDMAMLKTLQVFNKCVGSVDLFDQIVATYRVRTRSKKWWWRFFVWAVSSTMANAWKLFCYIHKQNVGILPFQREIAMTTVAAFGKKQAFKSTILSKKMLQTLHVGLKIPHSC